MSSAFAYRSSIFHAEAVPVPRIAEAYGTPFYCYARAELHRAYDDLASALQECGALICFAVKANGNLSIIRSFAERGAGADVVSVGELHRALAAGVPPEKIIFSGVGKTRAEIDAALVEPQTDKGHFGDALALRDLALVMREDVVLAAGVQIQGISEQ